MGTSELTADDIREGYRLVFGRAVESDAVIDMHIQAHASRENFWRALLTSSEFRDKKNQLVAIMDRALRSDGSDVEHEVTPAQLATLLKRIREQWTRLGETEPHWSVLTDDRYKTDNLDDLARAEFYRTGADTAEMVKLFETRTGTRIDNGVCLELGCGTGRVTAHLARRFEHVIAVDISPGNLRLCEEHLKAQGITNVETRLVSDPADFETFPEIDFFFSVIVLQHNSPPVQKSILNTILGRIRNGGAALFQIPTAMDGYRFRIADYLATEHPVMEMHSLPTAVVLKLISDNNLVLRDVTPDPLIGKFGSNTFFASRP